MTSVELVRVLVADDHPLFRSSVCRAIEADPRLTLAGEVQDGGEALAAIEASAPDVAVVDLRMPELDGLQLVEAVRVKRSPTRIVLLSGHLQRDVVLEALQRGAAGVLSKLADAASLTDAIVAVARGETVIAPEMQEALRTRRLGEQPALTARERQVLARVADGGTVASIAADMQLSASTVKTHLENVYRKLEVSDRAAAVAEAMRRGILH